MSIGRSLPCDRMDPTGPSDDFVMEVYENQRKKQPWGWGSGRKRHLRTSDPGRFSDHKGENRLHVKHLEQVGAGRRGGSERRGFHVFLCSPFFFVPIFVCFFFSLFFRLFFSLFRFFVSGGGFLFLVSVLFSLFLSIIFYIVTFFAWCFYFFFVLFSSIAPAHYLFSCGVALYRAVCAVIASELRRGENAVFFATPL